jgi:phosphopantothenoylcysteine synthetase/decarboxylase
MRFLVTAGNTREKIDQVRDWGNIFTGNTGYRIARAIAQLGRVDLVTSNLTHLAEIRSANAPTISGVAFVSHAQLRSTLESLMRANRYDAVFMSAAVADYRPAGVFTVTSRQKSSPDTETWVVRDVQAGKVKSTHAAIAVLGEQTEKIVDLFRREWRHSGLLIKFKLEVGISQHELIQIGQASRTASGADYLVANTLDMVDGPEPGAFLLSESGSEWTPRDQLPARMVRVLREHLNP